MISVIHKIPKVFHVKLRGMDPMVTGSVFELLMYPRFVPEFFITSKQKNLRTISDKFVLMVKECPSRFVIRRWSFSALTMATEEDSPQEWDYPTRNVMLACELLINKVR